MTQRPGRFLNWENPGKAFITGASAGMGASFAEHLAGKGFDPVLLARREGRLRELARKLESKYSVQCEVIPADLSRNEEIERVAARIRQLDNLDILVNNAGFSTIGDFAGVPIEKSMSILNVHMTAPVQFTHAALQGMLSRGRGAIINVSSLAAFIRNREYAVYNSTKAFLTSFSENLHLEVAEAGVRIQALCPGFTLTEFHEVGDFKGFDRGSIPFALWMSADEVVSLSLRALEAGKKTVFVPGWKNRVLKWILQHTGIASMAPRHKGRVGIE